MISCLPCDGSFLLCTMYVSLLPSTVVSVDCVPRSLVHLSTDVGTLSPNHIFLGVYILNPIRKEEQFITPLHPEVLGWGKCGEDLVREPVFSGYTYPSASSFVRFTREVFPFLGVFLVVHRLIEMVLQKCTYVGCSTVKFLVWCTISKALEGCTVHDHAYVLRCQ